MWHINCIEENSRKNAGKREREWGVKLTKLEFSRPEPSFFQPCFVYILIKARALAREAYLSQVLFLAN